MDLPEKCSRLDTIGSLSKVLVAEFGVCRGSGHAVAAVFIQLYECVPQH
jgi:hypothetical protein